MKTRLKVNNRHLKIIGIVILLLILPLTLILVKQIQDNRSSAAAPDKLEAEGGTLSSTGVSKQTDTGASGGSYVLFNKLVVSPTPSANCSTPLQTLVNNTPSGGTLNLSNCIYREFVTITKPITIKGPATMMGSDIVSGFSQTGTTYVSTSAYPTIYSHGDVNDPTALLLEQVFVDGVEYKQLANGATPGPGQFSMDSARHLVLGSNPSGKTVELSQKQILLAIESSNVTIDGMIFKYAASDSQRGAVTVRKCCSDTPVYSDVVFNNIKVLYNSGAGLVMSNNNIRVRVENSEIAYNKQLGIGGCGTNGYIGNNKVHHNNAELLWSAGWEAGGHKFGFSEASTGCIIENNEFNHNGGPGTWADTGGNDTIWRNNTIHDNTGNGIMIETSSRAQVYNNVLWENAWSWPYWVWGSCILVSSSNFVDIHDNTVAWCEDGITAASQGRDVPWASTNDHIGIKIHGNDIIFDSRSSPADRVLMGFAADWAGSALGDNSNTGWDNRYWSPFPEPQWARFACSPISAGLTETLAQFNSSKCEENGTYLTTTQRDAVLEAKGIPIKQNP